MEFEFISLCLRINYCESFERQFKIVKYTNAEKEADSFESASWCNQDFNVITRRDSAETSDTATGAAELHTDQSHQANTKECQR